MKRELTKKLIYIFEMVMGTILITASFDLIIIPQGFAAGGVTGFSRTICQFFGWKLSTMVLIMNLALLLVGLIFVGWSFVAKTCVLSILFPIALEILSPYAMTNLSDKPVISILLASILLGNGAGLILRSGASSGGFDIIGVILNKKWNIPVAKVMRFFDCTVILMQAFHQPLSGTIFGIMVILLNARIVDFLLTTDFELTAVTQIV